MRIVNREKGSGARATLDAALSEAGIRQERITRVRFSPRNCRSNLEVARQLALGLGFIPLQEESYDLVMFEDECEWTPVKSMLDALNSGRFAREVNQLCTYATDQMGQVVAHMR